MKNIFASALFLILSFAIATAQPYKIYEYNGLGGISVVDTGISGQTFSPNGAAGATWKTNGAVVVLKNDTLTTGQTLVGTPLQFNAADTQTTYEFDMSIIDTSSSAPGLKIGFAIPSGATIRARVWGEDSTSKQGHWELISAGATASGAFQMQNATGGMITVHGTLVTGSTAGNAIFQFLKGTNGTAGILKYSYIVWRKVY